MVLDLLTAVIDRWPSFSRFGSRKLPRFLGALVEQFLHQHNSPFSIILKWQPSFSSCWRPTCVRQSFWHWEIDLVPPLLPCWSIVIAAGENGVSTKTGGARDRSVLMDQCWLQWLNKLLPALKAVRPEEKIWTFDRKTATDILGRSGMTVCQTRQWSQHRPGAGFQYSARSARNEGGRLPLSPAPAPRQAGNTRATCRGNAVNATTSPAPHKRLTGQLLLQLFGGSGFLAESDQSFGFALLCARHEVRFQVWRDKISLFSPEFVWAEAIACCPSTFKKQKRLRSTPEIRVRIVFCKRREAKQTGLIKLRRRANSSEGQDGRWTSVVVCMHSPSKWSGPFSMKGYEKNLSFGFVSRSSFL